MLHDTMKLTPEIEQELQSRVRSRVLRADDSRRARLILMLADGQSFTAIRNALGCNRSYIARWKQRFLDRGLAGLYSRHPGRAVTKQTPQLEARILYWTQKKPGDGSTHWSSRKLAKKLGISHMMVARVGDAPA
jgi:transposase